MICFDCKANHRLGCKFKSRRRDLLKQKAVLRPPGRWAFLLDLTALFCTSSRRLMDVAGFRLRAILVQMFQGGFILTGFARCCRMISLTTTHKSG